MYERAHLLNLPQELTASQILESTLLLLDPVDVVSCIKACRKLRSVVYNEHTDYMWRAMVLRLFDDPRERAEGEPVPDEIDWMALLKSRIHAREVAQSILPSNIVRRSPRLSFAPAWLTARLQPLHQDVLAVLPQILLDSARPGVTPSGVIVPRESENVRFLEELLARPARQSTLLGSPLTPSRALISSRLHTVYGLSDLDVVSPRIRGVAREKVYTMRNYGLASFWGPFLAAQKGERKPDWAMLESMMIVLGRNALDSRDRWSLTEDDLPAVTLDRCRPYTQRREEEAKAVEGDWAGVQGRWYRIVSFMDYNDLWDWNWSGSGPKALDDAFEVVKLMTLDLQVVSIGVPPDDAVSDARPPSSPSGSSEADSDFHPPSSPSSPNSDTIELFDHALVEAEDVDEELEGDGDDAGGLVSIPHVHILHIPSITLHPGGFNMITSSDRQPSARAKKYPTIYFSGTSSGHNTDPPVTKLRGRVDMGEDGSVLWRMTSRFSGHSWVSEGVQVGGVQSQAGVLVTWSELEHEEHGPAGPSWLWKSRSNTVAKERRDFLNF
ncbi:hypothetical protein CALCODRAFT_509241 [Calocera cornea HHB12733]|uniref:F-box domain-containing protein n=1 Tax=Calocera cornea HHB12733 TaxID=1353952 RepID=A0A165FIK1_9BASI|nr:hypothetical protein CALCODRAFT_509241 [Calocera cornea HHB12733]